MYKPVHDNILILPEEPKQKSVVIVQEDLKPETGMVVSVGDDVREVESGDRVQFHPQMVMPVKIEGKDFLQIVEKNIIVVFKEGESDNGQEEGDGTKAES